VFPGQAQKLTAEKSKRSGDSATEVSSGHFPFTDPQATNNSKRFYRVHSP
jgi:hypothetical protein